MADPDRPPTCFRHGPNPPAGAIYVDGAPVCAQCVADANERAAIQAVRAQRRSWRR